jgi:glucokinase
VLAVIRHYLGEHDHAGPRCGAIGIANPVTGDRVQMTNHDWSFSISEVKETLGLDRFVVINDFTALALALPALTEADLHRIGSGAAKPGAALAVLGPGTGLGVSGLLPTGPGRFVPLRGEGGHVTLAASDERDSAVLQRLRSRFGHASAERAVSGPGLVNLYEATAALSGRPIETLEPSEVVARARAGNDASCVAALEMFFGFLGSTAGDLALTLGARGGVYLGGGIVRRLVPELARSTFRERFEAKGRFRGYLGAIPTFVIDSADVPAAIIGAARALDLDE